MAKQATLIVLFLIFAAAIFIQYMLISAPISSIEYFKGKKKRKAKKGGSKKGSSKKRGSKKGSAKKKSSKKGSAKKGSSKKGSAKKGSSKKGSSKKGSAKKTDVKKPATAAAAAAAAAAPKGYVNCPVGYTCTPTASSPLAFSEVVGSLISPSLPDSRDMKDKLNAAVDSSYKGKTPSGCPSDSTNSAIASRQMSMPGGGCSDSSGRYDMNSYVKKDSIPCYGCSL